MRIQKKLSFILLIAALALGGAACADEPTRDDSGDITETEDVNPNSLQAGDCFNDPDPGSPTQVTALEAVPCDEEHNNEVFHVFQLDDGDFPGADEVKQLGLDGCEPELEGYVGATAEDAGLAIVPVTPTEQSWNDKDDRTVLCALYKADGSKLTGSLEGSGGEASEGGTETEESEEPAAEEEAEDPAAEETEETEDTSAE